MITFAVDADWRVSVGEWDALTGAPKGLAHLPDPYHCLPGYHRHWHMAPDGRTTALRENLRTVGTSQEQRLALQGLRDDSALAYAPDGKSVTAIVHAPRGCVVRHWDVATGRQLHEWKVPDDEHSRRQGNRLHFSGDGRYLGVCQDHRWVCGWDITVDKPLPALGVPRDAWAVDKPLLAPVTGYLMQPYTIGDGPRRRLGIWELATGKHVRDLDEPAEVTALFSPDGKLLVTWQGPRLRVWEVATGKSLALPDNLTLPRLAVDTIVDVAVSSNSRMLALMRRDTGPYALALMRRDTGPYAYVDLVDLASVRLRHLGSAAYFTPPPSDKEDFECARWFRQQLGRPLAFAPDGKTLAATGHYYRVRRWDAATGEELWPPGEAHRAPIIAVAGSPDGKWLATAADDGALFLWDRVTGRLRERLTAPGLEAAARAVAFTPDSRSLTAISAWSDAVHAWNLSDGKATEPFVVSEAGLASLALSNDGRVVAVGDLEGQVVCCERSTGKLLGRFEGLPVVRDRVSLEESQRPLTVFLSTDGRLVVGIGEHHRGVQIHAWELVSGKLRRQTVLDDRRPDEIVATLSPDSRTLAFASNNTIRFWDVVTGREIRRLAGSRGAAVGALAFSANGRLLAAGDNNGDLFLYEAASGRLRAILRGHRGPCRAVAFTADGHSLLSGSDDMSALVWDLDIYADPPTGSRPDREMNALWERLADEDGERAAAALARLLEMPGPATALLGDRLHPATPLDPDRVRPHIVDLASNNFTIRQRATKELERLGECVSPFLRERLAFRPPLDERQRLERLLEGGGRLPTSLRALRAVEVLERLATDDARTLLKRLAEGAPGVRLTQEAQTALERMVRRQKD
jgi:WD40 repeat protein